jgi:hypothetical protein
MKGYLGFGLWIPFSMYFFTLYATALSSWRKEKYSQLKIRPILLLFFFQLVLGHFFTDLKETVILYRKSKANKPLKLQKILDFSVKRKMSARGSVTR